MKTGKGIPARLNVRCRCPEDPLRHVSTTVTQEPRAGCDGVWEVWGIFGPGSPGALSAHIRSVGFIPRKVLWHLLEGLTRESDVVRCVF